MMESPDVPWAKNHDTAIKKPIAGNPSEAAKSFRAFLKASDGCGRIAVCTSDSDAVLFADGYFEVHRISSSSDSFDLLQPYGINPHCFDLEGCWFFEDGYFDFILSQSYCEDMGRVLRKDGVIALASTEHPEGFAIVEGFKGILRRL